MKKVFSAALALLMVVCVLVSCKDASDNGSVTGEITVITREEGSGTRAAFTELLEIVDEDGNDAIYVGAEITEKTSVMLISVNRNKRAIGYVSLGSMSDEVKAIAVDGVEATAENVKSGAYKVSRGFNLAYKEDSLSRIAADFLKFVLSIEGQSIVEEEGYIAVDTKEAYTAAKLSGKLSLAGSSSVGPLAEILCEAYCEYNPDVTFEVQQTGSSAGMTSAIEEACDIGMASRELKDSEKQKLSSVTVAVDGIAVIVNNSNDIGSLTSEQLKGIYMGEITDWSELK